QDGPAPARAGARGLGVLLRRLLGEPLRGAPALALHGSHASEARAGGSGHAALGDPGRVPRHRHRPGRAAPGPAARRAGAGRPEPRHGGLLRGLPPARRGPGPPGIRRPAGGSRLPGPGPYAISGIGGVLWSLRHLVPRSVRQALKAGLRRPLDSLCQLTHPVPTLWRPGARAFAIPSNNMTSAIRINLKGREPFGAVAPGEENERVCQELIDGLLELENPATGAPAVQWVRRARELYQGPRLD